MIFPLAASADNVAITKTLTYNFTGVSNDGLVSNNPWGGDDGVFWTYVSGFHFWSTGASAIGAFCNYNSYVYTRSKETFPEVIQKVTVKAGAWSDVSTGLKLNNKEVKLKTISTNAYQGIESRIQFDDYVFENVSTSDNNGHLFLEYVLSGQADIFIRSITVEYEEGGKCDMSEIPTDNDFYAATSFLCERGILDGSKDDGKYSVEKKLLRKHLANITFRGLFTLKGREIPSTFVSDQYPAVYEDLKSDALYYQAAKTLLYLDYGDGITPFDRDRDGFFPDYSESRINVLKELMEAFNIKPDTEGTDNPFPDDPGIAELAETSPIRMGYVRQAAKLGIITTEHTAFHPHRECLRGEAFLMLARIIQKIEAGEIADPNPQESDFLDPNSGPVTVDPNAEAYAVLSDNNSVVTFYYDDQKEARGGLDINNSDIYNNSSSPYRSATTAVIDASFADYRPISTAYWFQGCSSLTSITGMENLKTDNVTDMKYMFDGCSGLTNLKTTGFNTKKVTDMRGMFCYCSSLTNLDVMHFDTQEVTNMYAMFAECSGLTSLDLSNFNTAKVTDMSDMFSQCPSLTSLDVSNFNTAKVTDMGDMFQGCSGLTSLDVSNFNTANITEMICMFSRCSGLTSLDVSCFNTAKVKRTQWMFAGCSKLTTIYAGSGWTTASVTLGDAMFDRCTNLKGGAGTTYNANHKDYTYARIDGGADNPGYFTPAMGSCDMSEIPTDNAYYAATSFLCERGVLDGSKVDGKYLVEKELLRKHLANITFRGLFALKGREIPSTFVSDQYPDIYDDLKSDASYYQAAKTLLYLDYGDGITPFDRDRDGFFPDNNESRINILKELMEAFNIKPDTEGTNNPFPTDPGIVELSETSPIKMGYVRQAAKLGIITTENEQFHPYEDCLRGEAFLMLARIIQKIEAGEITDPNPQESDFLDPNSGTGTAEPYAVLSDDNTVVTFYYDNQKAARGGIDINKAYVNGDTNSKSPYGSAKTAVIDASFANYRPRSTAHWFEKCSLLTSITGMENLKTDNVTNMEYMFRGCYSLTSLDVTGFNTQNVTNMSLMFINCCSLTSLDVTSFNTQNVTDMSYMFYLCSGLTSLDLSGFNTQNVTNMSEMFCICSGLKTILAGNDWSTAAVSEGGDMFLYCSKLVGGAGTTYNEKRTNQTYAHIDGGTANPGYFTAKAEGDLNGDGKVDEADVAVLVSVVMGDRNKLAGADLNHDEKVDAADVVTLVNMIMNQKKETQH